MFEWEKSKIDFMNGPTVPIMMHCFSGLKPFSHYCLSNETGLGHIG